MANQKFLVQISGTDMYLTGYNPNDPPNSIFGNQQDAIEYNTQADADEIASNIGAGTVGTPK